MAPDQPDEGTWRPTRRQFIVTSTGAVAAVTLGGAYGGAGRAAAAPPAPVVLPPLERQPTFTAGLRRREDLLSLRFEFFNLRLVPAADSGLPATVVRDKPGPTCVIAVVFPPQHVVEEAFLEKSEFDPNDPDNGGDEDPKDTEANSDELPRSPAGARLAGESRLAFLVPDSSLPLAYTTESLLTWAAFSQRVVPHASVPATGAPDPKPREPGRDETAIELPWRLQLSPDVQAGWAHQVEPVRHDGRTELWHTRLGFARQPDAHHTRRWVDETFEAGRTVRAVWSGDPRFDSYRDDDDSPTIDDAAPVLDSSTLGNGIKIRLPLDELDRYDIVRLSSDWTINRQIPVPETGPGVTPRATPTVRWRPSPAQVDRLMLSGLGGWVDLRGVWDLPQSVPENDYESSLLEWRHKAEMGRDSYVRIVRKGYLCPTGHQACLVKITERKFVRLGANQAGDRGAFLRQRVFIVCRRPVVSYDTPLMAHGGRKFPFRSLRCTTLVTPNLSGKEAFAVDGDTRTFIAEVGGEPYPFHFVGTDWAGRTVDFTTPIVWVDDTIAYSADGAQNAGTDSLIAAYMGDSAPDDLRVRPMHGAKLVVADSAAPGDTTVQVQSMTLGVELPKAGTTKAQLLGANRPRFFPTVEEFTLDLPEAAAVAGKALAQKPRFGYYARHLDGDTAGNKAELFLTATAPATLAFDTGSAGGLVTPNFAVKALSRALGPVGGDVETIRTGEFDPEQVFDLDAAKILGGISLADILAGKPNALEHPEKALTVTSRELANPRRVETTMDWHPDVASGPDGVNLFEAGASTALDLTAVIISYLDDPAQSTYSIAGDLRSFALNLFGIDEDTKFLRVEVSQLRFTSSKGKKPDVDVDVSDVEFFGALKFVATLAEELGFADGSGLVVTTDGSGIRADVSVHLPALPLGVFSLKGLAVSGGVAIPFDGSPVRVRFAFSSREDPFVVTFYGLGGTGFVGVELGADGVELLEFCFAFAACLSLDIGVASGSVEVTAGIAYSVETRDDGQQVCTLTAFVRLVGELEVLLIVSLSLEFYLGLKYVSNPESLVGEAKLTVTVSVAMFEKDVTLHVRRKFTSSGSGAQTLAARQALGPTALPELSFGDFLSAGDWKQYAAAFAPVGA